MPDNSTKPKFRHDNLKKIFLLFKGSKKCAAAGLLLGSAKTSKNQQWKMNSLGSQNLSQTYFSQVWDTA